ncbi:outer membrane protein TolC [Sporomusaceae bacterium BoRhaA]|uniref:hypothetical protein n=1 Tax=Pelorhabdus rhamnosifermentans TaxID=2772457 RepID=UPI001C063076|nr:hypothetical protein [Pelorhabdus rhamnosifermentans]MBU2700568.1 outer membrane protein TolC [Pelorhabdus rhamnosifermentans]
MGIILELVILLFLILITISIIGLLWSFLRKKPKRRWMMGLILNLLFFIGTAVSYNNYLVSQEQEESLARYQEQQQTAKLQAEKATAFQNFATQKLMELEQNVTDKTNTENLEKTQGQLKKDIVILNAKIDYLIKYITSFLK